MDPNQLQTFDKKPQERLMHKIMASCSFFPNQINDKLRLLKSLNREANSCVVNKPKGK